MNKKRWRFVRTIAALCSAVLLFEAAPVATNAETNPAGAENGPVLPEEEADPAAVLLGEDKTIREADVKYFVRSDGNREAAVYEKPVHYQEDGEWKDIDNTLKETTTEDGSRAYQNTANDLQVTLPEVMGADSRVEVAYGEHRLTFTMDTAGPSVLTRARSAVSSIGEVRQPSESNLETLKAQYQARKNGEVSKPGFLRRLFGGEEASIEAMSDTELVDAINQETRNLKKLGSGITYTDVLPNTHIAYDIDGRKLKESLVFDQLPLQGEFRYTIACGNLTAEKMDDGSVIFRDGNTPVFTIEAPYMWDTAKNASADIEVGLTSTEGGYIYTLTPSREWLEAEERVYPVTLDPSITSGDIYTVKDTSVVYGSSISSDVRNKKYLYVGTVSGTEIGTAIYTPIPEEVLKSGRILNSYLHLWYSQESTSSTPALQINAYSITSNWNVENISEDKIIYNASSISYDPLALDYAMLDDHVAKPYYELHTFDVTKAAQHWMSGDANYGILLRGVNNDRSSHWMRFLSSDFSLNSQYSPKITFIYRNMTGIENYWSYTTASSGRAGDIYVNNYTGELTVTTGLSSTNHNRMPLSIGLVYNGSRCTEQHSAGKGWHMNYIDIVIDSETGIEGYPYSLRDMDGTLHYFVPKSGDTVFQDEDGLGLTLTKNSDGTMTIEDKSGTKMKFTNYALTSIEDSNRNCISLNLGYMQSNVTDGADYQHTLTFSQVPYRLMTVGDSAGRSISLEYNMDGHLTSITYPDGEKARYYYDGDRIGKVIDVDGSWIAITYDVIGRVTSLTECSADEQDGEALLFDYTQARHTSVTDRRGRRLNYNFDIFGRVTDITDGDGYSKSYTMTNESVEPAQRNKLTLQSDLQKGTINYAKDFLGYFWTGTDIEGTPQSGSYSNTTDSSTQFLNRISHRTNISSLSGTSRMYVYSCAEITLQPGTYTFSGYVQTNFVGSSHNPNGGAKMQVSLGDGLLATAEPITRGDTGWTRQSVTFTVPSARTVQMRIGLEDRIGTVWYNGLQMEKGETANNVNLLSNAAFEDIRSGIPHGWNRYIAEHTTDNATSDGRFRVIGEPNAPGQAHGIWQDTDLCGAGEVYVYSGWAKADSVMPSARMDLPLRLVARVDYDDTTYKYVDVPFNPACNEEQFVSGMVDTRWEGQNKPYHNIEVMALYQNSLNTAEFWGLCLQQDAYGTSFTYDSNGNLVNSEDQAKQESSFTYSGADLSRLVEPTGNFALYAYSYDERNLIRTDTKGGVASSFTYDEYGNPTSSSTFYHPFETTVKADTEYIFINKKSGMVIDIGGHAAGLGRDNKEVFQYNNKKNILQKFVTRRYGDGLYPNCFVLDAVYDQDMYQSPLHLGFAFEEHLSKDILLQRIGGYYLFEFIPNGDGSFRIRNDETGYYLTVQDGSTETYAKIIGDSEYRNTDGSHPEQDWYVQTFDAPAGNRIESSMTYTDNGAYASSVTDSRGQATNYTYLENRGLLSTQEDPRGNVTQYTYNSMSDKLTKVEQKSGGVVKAAVEYGYTKDQLTRITHNGFDYTFTYDRFGNPLSTQVAGQTLSTNIYGPRNGFLERMNYGNGAYIEYQYDPLYRVNAKWLNGIKQADYLYDNQGDLYRFIDMAGGYTERYMSDMAGRPTRMIRTGNHALETVYGYGEGSLLSWKKTRVDGRETSLQMEYNKNSQPTKITASLNGTCLNQTHITYDNLGRVSSSSIMRCAVPMYPVSTTYEYLSAGTGKTTSLVRRMTTNGRTWTVDYDGNGNITSLADTAGGTFLYEYDALNQLVKETRPNGDVYVYGYDAGGNITTRTKNGTPLHTYGYASTGWKDLLTSFDGTSITYDPIGNPNNWRDGMAFTWQAGRQLANLQKGSTGVSYTYNSDGTRLTKTINGVQTSYTWDGAQLVSQTTTGGDTLYFLYHGSSRVGLEYKGNTYYYIYNLQGDVVGLVNSSGTSVVSYTYDAWGNPESTTGSMASTLGAANPFRYRSYYFDTESGLYYLMSRYYDPVVGRFIAADVVVDNANILGTNIFVYCWNNPISLSDSTGKSPEALAIIDLGEEIASSSNIILAAIGKGLSIAGEALLAAEEKDYQRFLDGISNFESANAGNYQAVNSTSGALGRYQVLPRVLNSFKGYENVTAEQFLNDPAMQERFIRLYHAENWRIIKSMGLNKKVGSTFNGALITDAGLLVAAGFGAGNVNKTFSGTSTRYKNGITVRLNYFEDYNIKYITGY